MQPFCPYCSLSPDAIEVRPGIKKFGRYKRRSDSRVIQRFQCLECRRTFSHATQHPCYRQKKRQKNFILRELICSGVSQRRVARILHLHRSTVVRKLLFLAKMAEIELLATNQSAPIVETMEFDDMETFEHTKCKPLSITLAVEFKTRRILGFEVSQIPARGKLAAISRKKYGFRRDERKTARNRLFTSLKPFVHPAALIKSDSNPHYPADVKVHFPLATHRTIKGKRGCIVGQGELKKVGFDPIFSFNHTAAKIRGDVNRLFRRTWCTTKKAERLRAHLMVYAVYHNQHLN